MTAKQEWPLFVNCLVLLLLQTQPDEMTTTSMASWNDEFSKLWWIWLNSSHYIRILFAVFLSVEILSLSLGPFNLFLCHFSANALTDSQQLSLQTQHTDIPHIGADQEISVWYHSVITEIDRPPPNVIMIILFLSHSIVRSNAKNLKCKKNSLIVMCKLCVCVCVQYGCGDHDDQQPMAAKRTGNVWQLMHHVTANTIASEINLIYAPVFKQ